ncbi:MAG: MoxR family ATPase [Epsilonproteobacteria bacterium]|nr:MoxR family ATPase [Campylobacterota bacterium]
MQQTIEMIRKEVSRVIVGHEALIERMMTALICEGHLLVEGVPGLAKTTAVNALAKALGLRFKRVQFTPDLLPGDITGSEVYDQREGRFYIKEGPVFTNLLLADEINRAPAKVQSALLEVMQERQVTIGQKSLPVPRPFMVMATQNPVEQEGTYRLPEAQLDRFMMKVVVGYNTLDEELEMVARVTGEGFGDVTPVAGEAELTAMREAAAKVHVDEAVRRYMLKLVFATRYPDEYGLESLKEMIEFGASPRASIDLYKTSRATAMMRGRDFVTPLDVADVAFDVLRHRIILGYRAEAAGVESDEVIREILKSVKAP